ncbi:hypothetical protein L9F63_020520, partial [Diploptera punctata]
SNIMSFFEDSEFCCCYQINTQSLQKSYKYDLIFSTILATNVMSIGRNSSSSLDHFTYFCSKQLQTYKLSYEAHKM